MSDRRFFGAKKALLLDTPVDESAEISKTERKRDAHAARDLGATQGQALRRIVLPLTLPAIVAGWLLSFTLSLDDVVVSFFVTGPEFEVLPLRIYSMVRMGVKPEVNALATLMFAVSLTVVIVSQRLLHRRS